MTGGFEKQPGSEEELAYRRRWLHQLRSEFRQICSWYGLPLKAPGFRISDGISLLGSWDAQTRTISIAAGLISQYSWDSVINVLKHEMAHQYVHEVLQRGMETPHGPLFKEACLKLGLTFPFDTAAGNTPRVFSAEKGHTGDPEYAGKIDKVRKMLSLAGSSNRHEAAAAMSKANSFIRRYNLERLESAAPSRYSYEIINTGKKRLPVIERKIAALLLDYFYVDVVYSELFDPAGLESFKTIELLGTLENVSFARHAYDFLQHRLDLLWRNYRKRAKLPGRLRKTYILGVLEGFREKLETEEKSDAARNGMAHGAGGYKTISALVVAGDPGLAQFTALRFPRLRRVRYRASAIHCRSTYKAGKTEGRKITIHKAIDQETGYLGRLLGDSI